MSIFAHWRLLIGLAAVALVLTVSFFALNYLFPGPPSKITIATGLKGGSYELLANKYRAILARSHVDLEVRLTNGTSENLKLLEDKSSGVEVGFAAGGVSDAAQSPNLLSLGRVSYDPFWVFYRAGETWPDLSSLKGKRIAAGPVGSAAQIIAEKLLGVSGIEHETKILSISGETEVEALTAGRVDAAVYAGVPGSSNIQALLHDPAIRLMNFPRAEALTRIYPFLVHLILPAGAIDFADDIPPADVNMIGTTNAVLVRKDLHPQIVYLLAQALLEVHGDAGLFKKAGEFPTTTDPEYPMAESALFFYKSGPTMMNRLLPFWVANYVQRAAALIAAVAIVLPALSYTPRLYLWFAQLRLRKLYRRLRVVEAALQGELTSGQAEALQGDLDEIDGAAAVVPMRDSDLFFIFRHHLDQTRSRLAARLAEAQSAMPSLRGAGPPRLAKTDVTSPR
jgi:TRAP transporter TAXI family solute receptor